MEIIEKNRNDTDTNTNYYKLMSKAYLQNTCNNDGRMTSNYRNG